MSSEKFSRCFEKVIDSMSVNQSAVLTMVQFVTLPSPETE